MTTATSCVTIHMAASLDGFVARRDGRVDWLETTDHFAGGATLDAATAAAFLSTIDCYVMGARTYETAVRFAERGFGWAYGETPTWVLTHHPLPRLRDSVHFHSGDLGALLTDALRPRYRQIWIAGGGTVAGECLARGLADELRYSILPIVIGDGLPFFGGVTRDVPLHLLEVTPYVTGMVAMRYAIGRTPTSSTADA